VGQVPRSPLTVDGPVLVTPVPARMAKLVAVPRPTGASAAPARDMLTRTPTTSATPTTATRLRVVVPTKGIVGSFLRADPAGRHTVTRLPTQLHYTGNLVLAMGYG